MYTTLCEIDSWGEAAVERRELSLVLCDGLEEWDGGGAGGKFKRKEYMYKSYI